MTPIYCIIIYHPYWLVIFQKRTRFGLSVRIADIVFKIFKTIRYAINYAIDEFASARIITDFCYAVNEQLKKCGTNRFVLKTI